MKTIKLFLSLCFICFFTYFGFQNFHEMGLPDHSAGMFISFSTSWICIFLFEMLWGSLKGCFSSRE